MKLFTRFKCIRYISVFACTMLSQYAISQAKNNFCIELLPEFNGQVLQLNSYYKINNGADSIAISNFKFYISNIALYKNKQKVFTEKNSYHLVDVTNKKGLNFNLAISKKADFNYIQFNLGIDSATNATGVRGGDLDPTKGMYWAWHSGYINFKLEGNSNLCATRNHAFEFHLGGYKAPYSSLQTIRLAIKDKAKCKLVVDIVKFLQQINIAGINQIMTPGKDAVSLSEKAAAVFSIEPDKE